jgi:hypothetical protein
LAKKIAIKKEPNGSIPDVAVLTAVTLSYDMLRGVRIEGVNPISIEMSDYMKRDYLQIVTNCMERAKDRDLQWAINQANQEFQARMKEKDWAENRALN